MYKSPKNVVCMAESQLVDGDDKDPATNQDEYRPCIYWFQITSFDLEIVTQRPGLIVKI